MNTFDSTIKIKKKSFVTVNSPNEYQTISYGVRALMNRTPNNVRSILTPKSSVKSLSKVKIKSVSKFKLYDKRQISL